MAGLQTQDVRLAKLREEEERLEGLMQGTEQEEQVLDNEDVVAPDESSDLNIELTDDVFNDETAHEDTQKPIESDEIARLTKELADEKHRFGRYKGSTDRTIFDLRKALASSEDSVAKLKAELLNRTETQETGSSLDDAFSQDVVDILGEEAVDAIKKTVQSAQDKANQLERKLSQGEIDKHTDTAKDLAASNEADFMTELRRLVPNLDAMNRDPGFNEWLREAGPDGVERLTRLHRDQKDFDAYRVASFFTEYEKTKVVKKDNKVKDSVSNHIGPTGTQSGSSNSMVDETKQGYMNQSTINQFNLEVARGDYKYESAKAEAMEAKIFKAMNEGKIIFDENPI